MTGNLALPSWQNGYHMSWKIWYCITECFAVIICTVATYYQCYVTIWRTIWRSDGDYGGCRRWGMSYYVGSTSWPYVDGVIPGSVSWPVLRWLRKI